MAHDSKIDLRRAIEIRSKLGMKVPTSQLALEHGVSVQTLRAVGRSAEHPPELRIRLTDELVLAFYEEADATGRAVEDVASARIRQLLSP